MISMAAPNCVVCGKPMSEEDKHKRKRCCSQKCSDESKRIIRERIKNRSDLLSKAREERKEYREDTGYARIKPYMLRGE